MKTFFLSLTVLLFTTILYGQTNPPSSKFDFNKVKTKGYINTLEVGGVFGVGQVRNFYANTGRYKEENNSIFFSLHNISSWKLNAKSAIGFGFGVELGTRDIRYDDDANFNFPIFADFRYRPITKRFSPIFIEQVGFSLFPFYYGGKGEPLKTGALLNSKLGLNAIINNRTSMTFGAGYRFQHYAYKGWIFSNREHIDERGQRATVHDLYHFLSCFVSVQF